jgi:hypothetical protein
MKAVFAIDVTDPTKLLNILDRGTGKVLKTAASLDVTVEDAGEGNARLVLADGQQLEQVPGQSGVAFAPKGGSYGLCRLTGALVAFKVHPDYPAAVYSLAELP